MTKEFNYELPQTIDNLITTAPEDLNPELRCPKKMAELCEGHKRVQDKLNEAEFIKNVQFNVMHITKVFNEVEETQATKTYEAGDVTEEQFENGVKLLGERVVNFNPLVHGVSDGSLSGAYELKAKLAFRHAMNAAFHDVPKEVFIKALEYYLELAKLGL